MDPTFMLIAAVAFLIVLAAVFTVIKGILKIIFTVFSIISIVLMIGGAFVFLDGMELKNKFMTEEKKIVLKGNGEVLTGFVMTTMEEQPSYFTQEQVDTYTTNLQIDNLDSILGTSYKIILIDLDIMENVDKESFDLGNQEFSKEFLILLLESDDPKYLITQELGGAPDMENSELKAVVFGVMFNEVLQDPILFIEEYKEGNLMFYPETAMFKALKFLPIGLMKSAMEGVVGKLRDKLPII